MAWDFSTLTDYVKDNNEKLMTRLVFNARTISMLLREGNVLTSVKTSERVGQFSYSTTWQDGNGCGFTPSGTAAITQRSISVAPIKINDEFCLNDLEKKYTQLMLQQGSMPESLPGPIEGALLEQLDSEQDRKMEILTWQGDTALTGDPIRKWTDGFIKLIDSTGLAVGSNATRRTGTITSTTGSTSVSGTGTSFSSQVTAGDKIYSNGTLIGTVSSVTNNTTLVLTANGAAAVTGQPYSTVNATQLSYSSTGTTITGPITQANVQAAVDALYMSISQDVLDSAVAPVLFVGTDVARMWLMTQKNADLRNYTISENDLENGFKLPGFGLRIFPTPGLAGTGRMFAIQPKNMWFGTDMEDEWKEYDWWFSKDADKLRMKARWKTGFQIGYPEYIAQFQSA